MQPIPAGIETLLRSRSLTGTSAPAAQVLLTDKATGTDWASHTAFFNPSGDDLGIGPVGDTGLFLGELSVAKKANGRLIVVGCVADLDSDTDIMVTEGEVADYETLTTANDCLTGLSATGITLHTGGRACAFRVGSGLYLIVSQAGKSDGTTPGPGNWIYRSPSGNGGDWILHGTIDSYTVSGTRSNWIFRATVGPPLVLDSGRWVISAPYQTVYSGYPIAHQTIYTSDDAGLTWTRRTSLIYGGLATMMEAECGSRTVVQTADGTLWCATDYDWGDYRLYVWKSTDQGEIWSIAWYIEDSVLSDALSSPTLYGHPYGVGFYIFSCAFAGTSVRLRYCAQPATDNENEVIDTWTTRTNSFYRPLCVDLTGEDHAVLTAGVDVLGFTINVATLTVDSIEISREQAAMAQRAVLSRPNVNPADPADTGYYSPDRGDDDPELANQWADALLPGKGLTVKLGYGADLATSFTGAIDQVTLEASGAGAHLTLECRDDAWQIIDKVVTNDSGGYKLTYANAAVEAIVADLLERAGIDPGDITTEATGITVAEKSFERISYADALAWCQTVSGFELVCDELGAWSFHYPTDRQPEAADEALVLSGTAWTELAQDYVVTGSERVRSAVAGGGTLYVKDTDYEIEYGDPARIRRKSGGSILDGGTVYVTYVHAAWSFEQGVDLFRLPYRISRRDLYGKIVVLGQDYDGDLISASYIYSGSTAYGVPTDKVLFVEIRELDTSEKCQACADQLGADMVKKLREVSFAAVGNPWIQVGDCVRVRESSSTASEIYRVTSLSHRLDAGGFVTQFTAYHYGYTPL